MGEAGMPNIMKQCRQAEELPGNSQWPITQTLHFSERHLQQVPAKGSQTVEGLRGHLHHPEGMLEPGVGGAWVKKLGQGQLPNES
jgi:hypothetical protein